MKKYTPNKTMLKTTAMMLSMFSIPCVADAQGWSWEREAENATLTYANVSEATAEGNVVSGGQYVSEMNVAKGSRLDFQVTGVPAAGVYNLTIDYISMQHRYLLVEVDGYDPILVACDEITGSWSGVAGEVENKDGEMEMKPGVVSKTIPVYLNRGRNFVYISAFEGETDEGHMSFAPNIDKITLTQSETTGEGVKTMEPLVVETESGVLSGSATKAEHKDVYPSGDAISLLSSGKATYTVNVPVSGAYAIYLDYTTCQTRWITLKVNSQPKHYLEFDQLTPTWGDSPKEEDPNKPLVMHKGVLVYMEAGENTIVLGSYNGPTSGHSDSPNLDKMTIRKVQAEIEDPGLETVAFNFDFTDMAKMTCNGVEADANIYDNNENTVWNAGASTVTLDAEMPYPLALTGYAVASPDGTDTWKLSGSADGENWVNIEGGLNTSEGSYKMYTVTVDKSAPIAYKYYRLSATADNEVRVGEWQLFGSPCVGTDRNLPADMFNGNSSSDVFQANDPGIAGWPEEAFNVLDGMLNTKYTTGDVIKSPDSKNPIELTYLVEGMARSYSLTSVWNMAERNPASWELLGFPTDGDDWVVLDSRENMKFPTSLSTLVFNIAEPQDCIGYMLRITKNNGSRDNTHLCAWQLFAQAQNITGPTEIASVEKAGEATAVICGGAGRIVMQAEGNAVYNIFAITGQRVNGGVVAGKAEVAVPAGLYVVVVNGKATKVLVK